MQLFREPTLHTNRLQVRGTRCIDAPCQAVEQRHVVRAQVCRMAGDNAENPGNHAECAPRHRASRPAAPRFSRNFCFNHRSHQSCSPRVESRSRADIWPRTPEQVLNEKQINEGSLVPILIFAAIARCRSRPPMNSAPVQSWFMRAWGSGPERNKDDAVPGPRFDTGYCMPNAVGSQSDRPGQ